MQSGGRSSSGPRAVYYRRRPDSDEAPENVSAARPSEESEEATQEVEEADHHHQQQHAAVAASSHEPPRWVKQLQDAASLAADKLRCQPAVPAGIAAATALGAVVLLTVSRRRGGNDSNAPQKSRGGGSGGARLAAANGSSAAAAAAAPPKPGPNSKLKPTASCAPTPDGHAVVVRRPIAADNSCLFNAVGYAMHHSTNRAPFLRQVVSREVSSDPQEYSAAFLGMSNAEYCAWIINPAHWGGGIELSILAAHYRREIAAWNLATGACHVFGEERGYTKRVMVIYNGAHYDVLAVSPSPRAPQEDDVTEFNPRTRRGKQIHAAAHALVQLNRRGATTPTHEEKQQLEKKQQRKAKAAAAAAGSSSSSSLAAAAAGGERSSSQQQPAAASPSAAATNGPVSGSSSSSRSPAPAAAPAGDSAPAAEAESGSSTVSANATLLCGICGVRLAGFAAAREHAAATGHTEFAEA